ncbi:hypothetical protein ILYODFUR_019212 [Ilyodon furcidens]|uniref:ZP domain-containing protein n=1 Tax=Ilyodon furcidens TaxID=33524 RepID=A0ABV0T0Z1_9TELE
MYLVVNVAQYRTFVYLLTPESKHLWVCGSIKICNTKCEEPHTRPPGSGTAMSEIRATDDCGSVGRVVVLQSEGCGFDSSFLLPYGDVPLGKALNLKSVNECVSAIG